jgi:phosphate:Na+ symporter
LNYINKLQGAHEFAKTFSFQIIDFLNINTIQHQKSEESDFFNPKIFALVLNERMHSILFSLGFVYFRNQQSYMHTEIFHTLVAIMAMVSLFLFSLQGFSKQLQKYSSESIKNWLGRVTKNKILGLLLGAGLTALIQSSSAVSSIVVALVDSGIISFYNSLSILLGTNIGTTFTAWLITFNIQNLGPILLVVGTIIGFLPWKINFAGKSIFYLGLILFSLQLISNSLEPIKNSENILDILKFASNKYLAIFIGMFLTALLQSSSVTTGLALVLATQGLLSLEAAIGIVVGCNIGTTSTAFMAAYKLGKTAKITAQANFIFNLIGLVVFFPFLSVFTSYIGKIDAEIGIQVATAHLIFNLTVALITFPFLNKIGRLIERKNVA